MGFFSELADLIDYMMFGENSNAAARMREQRAELEQRTREPSKQPHRKSGLQVGRPHTSKEDARVHVTSTHRNDHGKKVRDDKHHTSLGAIAHGAANWDTSRKRKK